MTLRTVTRAEWAEALRSGRYEQGKGKLRRGKSYCCLGVLCAEMGKPKKERGWDAGWLDREQKSFLRDGMANSEETALVQENDAGTPFSEIADMIEDRRFA